MATIDTDEGVAYATESVQLSTHYLGFAPYVVVKFDLDGQVQLDAGGHGATDKIILALLKQARRECKKAYCAQNREHRATRREERKRARRIAAEQRRLDVKEGWA